jgi:hypothetical protein
VCAILFPGKERDMNGRWLARALAASLASLPPAFATPPLPAPPPPSPPAEARAVSVPRGANVLVNGSFAPDDWRNEDWGANAIGMVAGEGGPKFLEPEGFEVQLSRAAVLDPAASRGGRGGEIALRVELKRPAAVFPAGTTDSDPAGWLRLAL